MTEEKQVEHDQVIADCQIAAARRMAAHRPRQVFIAAPMPLSDNWWDTQRHGSRSLHPRPGQHFVHRD